MRSVIKASVALVIAVMVISVLMYVTGLHENALIGGLGSLVLVIGANVGVVFWGLKQTAAENGYLRQLGNGALIGVIGGVHAQLFASHCLPPRIPNSAAALPQQ